MKSVKYEYKLSTTFEGKPTTMGPYLSREAARQNKGFLETQAGKFGKVEIIQVKTIQKKVR